MLISSLINEKLEQTDVPVRIDEHHLTDGFHQFPEYKWFVRTRVVSLENGLTLYSLTLGAWKTSQRERVSIIKDAQGNIYDGKLSASQKRAISKNDKQAKDELASKYIKGKETCEHALAQWQLAASPERSDYFKKKNIDILEKWPAFPMPNIGDNQTVLVVPGYDQDGELWNIQRLFPAGKFFQKGARAKDLIHWIGVLSSDYKHVESWEREVLICEGFATATACALATGYPTLSCFSAGNLEYGVKAAKRKYPKGQIIICADNDAGTQTKEGFNPGLLAACELALKYEVKVAYPLSEGNLNTDFCDLWPNTQLIESFIYAAHSYSAMRNIHLASMPKTPLKKKASVTQTKKRSAFPLGLDSQVPQAEGLLIDITHTKLPPDSKDELVTVKDITTLEELLESKRPEPKVEKFNYDAVTPKILADRGEKGAVQATINNFRILCDFVGATLRYNVIAKDQDWIIPGEDNSLDQAKDAVFARLEDLCVRAHFPIARLSSYLTYLCNQHQYNPVEIWIKSKPWDRVSRLEALYSTVQVAEESLDPELMRMKKVLILKWLAMAVKGAISPRGISTPGMLVFQGAQSLGKTSWFKSLVPETLELIADGKSLNPHDKDSVKQVVKYWLVELGELDATFKKAEIAALKAFITKDQDEFRAPYAKTESRYARRTVFFGSVNDINFLVDETGNRRFWALEVEKLHFNHSIDMQQLWAEVHHLVTEKGQTWWLTKEEEEWLNKSNEAFQSVNPIEEQLLRLFDWDTEGEHLTATEIALKLDMKNPQKHDTNQIARIVRKLNGGQKMKPIHKRRVLWTGKLKIPTSF